MASYLLRFVLYGTKLQAVEHPVGRILYTIIIIRSLLGHVKILAKYVLNVLCYKAPNEDRKLVLLFFEI